MERRARIVAAVAVAFAFLGASALLARALGGRGAERAAVLAAVGAQARGDERALLRELGACAADPTCARLARERTRRLRRPGAVRLLAFDPSIGLTLTRQAGVARVAWATSGASRPVVQCARVVREGPLGGPAASVLSLSDPIPGQGACPR